MLFLLLGAVYSGKIDGFRAADVLLVGMIGYGCANTAFAGLAITLVIRRESGVLKRIRATPLPMVTYLAAVLCSTLVVFVLQMLLTITLGLTLYGAKGPENWLGMILAAPLGRGCVGRRQPDRPTDGVPVRLVRADAPVSRGTPLGRGRLAADLPD